jgi:hypothetical protein
VLVVAVVAAALASSASGALFFLFEPIVAKPGELVTVRLGGTPASFTLANRVKPFQRPIRVYLVPNDVADTVHSRFDRRLSFVGQIVPDKNVHGVLRFSVPPLDSNTYVAAAWCPGCARHSSGRAFFVISLPDVSRYLDVMALDVEMPPAAETCPLTHANRGSDVMYGNGFLSTAVSTDGGLVAQRQDDGTLFTKLGWLPRKGFTGLLTVRGERLDAPAAPMRVLGVHWGHNTSTGRGSWASALTFPTEGCWRISGRVGDIALSYVVRVIGV